MYCNINTVDLVVVLKTTGMHNTRIASLPVRRKLRNTIENVFEIYRMQ